MAPGLSASCLTLRASNRVSLNERRAATLVVHKSTKDIRKLYNKFARDYDRVEGTFDVLSGVGRRRDRWFRRARGRVLEVGAGTARTIEAYSRADLVVLTELSDKMLRRASERVNDTRIVERIRFLQCDMQLLPFADRSFDTVVSSQTLCTVTDPLRALQEMGRVCKRDGIILLSEHGLSDRHTRVNALLERYTDLSVTHLGCHPNRDPETLALAAGLHVVQVQRSLLGIFIWMELAP
ncbi:methyltransferase domain-containing protein [bacterium]|nr:methyltransferase domain-containing protein [bacterium]